MIAYKPNQLDQGLRGQKGWARLRSGAGRRREGDGKVRPVPGQGEKETILTAQEHPGASWRQKTRQTRPACPQAELSSARIVARIP